MKYQKGYTSVEIVFAVLFVVGLIGWILNICKLVAASGTEISDMTIMIVLRAIGVFAAPLGAVLGFL